LNVLFKEHGVAPEKIRLTSGQVEVSKFSWHFRAWAGPLLEANYGGKGILDSEGIAVLAELAIIPILKQHGFGEAVWVDTFRRCFGNAMPPAICKPSKEAARSMPASLL
jgi:hypothetical protein